MKSPNSSTSASERPRAFLAVAALTAVAILGATATCAWAVKWRLGWTQNAPLLAYQDAKPLAGVDTVFVGDSSLGNAINSALFTQLTGHTSANLALNGAFGLGGSLGVLKCALERGPSIRNVVVMQATDMMSRPEHLRGLILSDLCGASAALPPPLRVRVVQAYVAELLDWTAVVTPPRKLLERLHLLKPERALVFGPDYPRQGAKGHIRFSNFVLTRTSPRAGEMLDQIGLLCRRARLNCVYAHGPIGAPSLVKADRYLKAADTQVAASGLALATPTPPPIAVEQVGNSEDHVAPPFRDDMTRRYATILAPYLR